MRRPVESWTRPRTRLDTGELSGDKMHESSLSGSHSDDGNSDDGHRKAVATWR